MTTAAAIAEMAEAYTAAWCSQDPARYEWMLIGTNTGPEGTGRAVRISGHEHWTLDASAVIRHSLGFFDAHDYAKQLTSPD